MLHIMYCMCLPGVPRAGIGRARGRVVAARAGQGSRKRARLVGGRGEASPSGAAADRRGPAASTASPTPAPRRWRRRWRTSRRSCPSTSGAYTPARRQASAAHAPLAQGRVSASPCAPSHAPLDRSRARGCRYGYGYGLARSPARGALFSARPAVSRDLGGLRRGCGPARGPSAPRAMSRDSVPGVEGCKACRAARRSP